jgi:hypothetical protein
MDDRERREMEARATLWGDLISGPMMVCASVKNALVANTAARWKDIADRYARRTEEVG